MPRKTTPLPDIGQALREWRAKRDITQRQAAAVFDISKRTYEGWEYGKLGPAYAKLMLAYLRLDGER